MLRVNALARRAALRVVHLGVGRRDEGAAPAIGAVHQTHDGHLQLQADWLAIAAGLVCVGSMIIHGL